MKFFSPFRSMGGHAARALVLTVSLTGLTVTATPALAAHEEILVTTEADGSPDGCDSVECTLREAIIAANEHAGPDVVVVPAGHYQLDGSPGSGEGLAQTGDLDILETVVVRGADVRGTPGAPATIIDGENLDRIFHVTNTIRVEQPADVTLEHLVLRDGLENIGGAVWVQRNGATLRLDNCTLIDNQVLGVETDGNEEEGNGGGLAFTANDEEMADDPVDPDTDLVIVDSVIRLNDADNDGGGVYVEGENLEIAISGSVLDRNVADDDRDGQGQNEDFFDPDAERGGQGGGLYVAPADGSRGVVRDPSGATLTIDDSAFAGNTTVGPDGLDTGFNRAGGGLFVRATTVTVTDSRITGNDANTGGGLFGLSSALTLKRTSVLENDANGFGGGLALFDIFEADVRDAAIAGNSSGTGGGGLFLGLAAEPRAATFHRVTIAANATFGFGGGLLVQGEVPPLRETPEAILQATVVDSTVSGNSSAFDGGGIQNGAPSQAGGPILTSTRSAADPQAVPDSPIRSRVNLTNVTVAENVAGTAPEGGSGGGVLNGATGELSLTHVTLARNAASSPGANLVNEESATARATIVADHRGPGGDAQTNCRAAVPVASAGGNLDDENPSTCGFTGPQDQAGAEPLLGPLQDNGGPTRTAALLPGSPAIHAVDGCPPPPTDQRGVDRTDTATSGCDSGAYEYAPQADLRLTKSAPSQVRQGETIDYLITVTNQGPETSTAVTVVDPLPSGTTFVGSSDCELSGETVRCQLGPLAEDASRSVQFTLRADVAGSLANTAAAEQAAPGQDPGPGNEDATAVTEVTPPPPTPTPTPSNTDDPEQPDGEPPPVDLPPQTAPPSPSPGPSGADVSVTKTASAASAVVGDELVYTITVSNAGPDSAAAVRVTDPLPEGLELRGYDTTRGACDDDQGSIVCMVGDVPPGDHAVVTITVSPTAPGTATNSAIISSATADPGRGNNAAEVSTRVAPIPPFPPGNTRVSGVTRIDTAIEISQTAFPDGGAPAVVLARADLYPDALAGTPLAVNLRGPLLLSDPAALDAATETEVRRVLQPGGTVVLLGGDVALSGAVADRLSSLGFEVSRYGGLNRFSTAVSIAREGLGDPSPVLLANGRDFPDALAAGVAGGVIGGAVLLTEQETLSPETSAYLQQRGPVTRFAIGGAAAAADPGATPLVGATRFETTIAVARTLIPSPRVVAIATARDFADALTGGVQVAALGGPILLSERDTLPASVDAYLRENATTIDHAILYGGEVALDGAVLQAVGEAIQ